MALGVKPASWLWMTRLRSSLRKKEPAPVQFFLVVTIVQLYTHVTPSLSYEYTPQALICIYVHVYMYKCVYMLVYVYNCVDM